MIPRALEAEIVRLYHAEHWPIGTIARQLRVHHATVRRALGAAGVAVAPKIVRASMIDPYRVFIDETLAKYPSLRASRLYTMVKVRGYPGAPDHFRALIAQIRPRAAPQAYLFSLSFIAESANVVMLGPNGLGKSMLIKNLAHHAVVNGHSALFILASDMLHDLAKQDSSTSLARRLRRYTAPALLAIDEVGYLSYDSRYADLFFEVVSRRYQHRPIVLSTNKPFSQWTEVFPNAACVVTLIDRLIHRAEIIELNGQSYRLKEAQERAAAKAKARAANRKAR